VTQGKRQDVMIIPPYCCCYLLQTGCTQEAADLVLACSLFTVVVCRQPLDCGAKKFSTLDTFCTLSKEKILPRTGHEGPERE